MKTTVANPVPEREEDYEVALDATLSEIERNRREMAATQTRIERLREETGAMLEETKRVLAKLAV